MFVVLVLEDALVKLLDSSIELLDHSVEIDYLLFGLFAIGKEFLAGGVSFKVGLLELAFELDCS